MDIYYKSSLERKSLPSKENYSTVEPEDMDVVTSDVSGGPRREQAFAMISRATVPFTYTKVAAVIRQSYPFHRWTANLPTPVPQSQLLFPNHPHPIPYAQLEPRGQAHS